MIHRFKEWLVPRLDAAIPALAVLSILIMLTLLAASAHAQDDQLPNDPRRAGTHASHGARSTRCTGPYCGPGGEERRRQAIREWESEVAARQAKATARREKSTLDKLLDVRVGMVIIAALAIWAFIICGSAQRRCERIAEMNRRLGE